MDTSAATLAIAPLARVGPASGMAFPAEQPPMAPPELVGKFEALMARVDAPSAGELGPSALSVTAVSKVEDQLALHQQLLDNVMAVGDGQMSLIDLQAFQMRSITQAGVLSMTHTAYVQVLSAGKGSVSSLMKNQ